MSTPIFHDRDDFERFIALMHIGNSRHRFITRDMRSIDFFSIIQTRRIVDVLAYCILPDGYHILLSERESGGAKKFIHKISTAYVMYYNQKHAHTGSVFTGTFRSEEIASQMRAYESIRHIHLHPSLGEEIFLGKAENANKKNRLAKKSAGKRVIEKASRYEYSSMRDYLGEVRPQNIILSR
jgi:REP element-mobilizing transposase RayT